MAGIGFELKKLFGEKGIILNIRANLYATMVVDGPIIMGAALLFGLNTLAHYAGATIHDKNVLVVIVTYSVLFPLLLTSLVSFVSTRYVADMLYENHIDRVLPSMYGVISLCLPVAAVIWIIFLIVNGMPFSYSFFSFMLVCEATVVWTQLSYINAAKDYQSAVIGFTVGLIAGLLTGYTLVYLLHLELVSSLLAGVCCAYGIMIVSFTVVLHRYFPIGMGSSLKFLEWMEKFPLLVLVGFFTTAGLFIHIFLMWGSSLGEQVIGYFYHAPEYDIPALLGLMTTLITTVNFVTSVELAFYPKYRRYFSLLNGGSSLGDLNKASHEMITVLKNELFYLAEIQLAVELIAIVFATTLLPHLGLGFNPVMIGLFRVLCVGYGLYAIGNSMVLFLLYLSDYRDAAIVSTTLFILSMAGTFLTLFLPEYYFGFGFVTASLAMFIVGWLLLSSYMNRLDYNIFSKQPIFVREQNGWLTRLARKLDSEQLQKKEGQ